MKTKLLFFAISMMIYGMSFSQNHPFPQNLDYQNGSIKPQGGNQKLNNDLTSFYYDWKYHYVKKYRNGYYIIHNPEDKVKYKKPNDTTIYIKKYKNTTVSEAHGYGMMIFVYMAGEDDQAKVLFDGMYDYYSEHLSKVNGHPDSSLMEWKQSEGKTKDNIPNGEDWHGTATDGDIDIAFALLLADAQWGSNGAINYKQEAIHMINDIMAYEIHPQYKTILLGDWAGVNNEILYNKFGLGTRTSDFIMDHFRSFKTATNDSKWNEVINRSYSIINVLQNGPGRKSGLVPDFVENAGFGPIPGNELLEGVTDGRYAYNACRVPWRLATDYLVSGKNDGKNAVNKINVWLKNKTNNNPEKIEAGYWLDGDGYGENYLSSAFIAPFAVSAMVDSRHQYWLNKVYEKLVEQSIFDEGYYENSIKMICLLTLSGNYWTPESFLDVNHSRRSASKSINYKIYPNPVNLGDEISIQLNGENGDVVVVNFYDIKGVKVYSKKTEIHSENQVLNIDSNSFAVGVYIINMAGKNKSEDYKLLITK